MIFKQIKMIFSIHFRFLYFCYLAFSLDSDLIFSFLLNQFFLTSILCFNQYLFHILFLLLNLFQHFLIFVKDFLENNCSEVTENDHKTLHKKYFLNFISFNWIHWTFYVIFKHFAQVFFLYFYLHFDFFYF